MSACVGRRAAAQPDRQLRGRSVRPTTRGLADGRTSRRSPARFRRSPRTEYELRLGSHEDFV